MESMSTQKYSYISFKTAFLLKEQFSFHFSQIEAPWSDKKLFSKCLFFEGALRPQFGIEDFSRFSRKIY